MFDVVNLTVVFLFAISDKELKDAADEEVLRSSSVTWDHVHQYIYTCLN